MSGDTSGAPLIKRRLVFRLIGKMACGGSICQMVSRAYRWRIMWTRYEESSRPLPSTHAAQQLQFEVQDVQLEVEITTTGTREGGGGLKIYVLTLGAKGSKSNASSQKVTLNLSAVTADRSRFRVRDMPSKSIRQDDE